MSASSTSAASSGRSSAGAAESENYVAFLASFTAVAAQVGFQGRTRVGLMAFCLLSGLHRQPDRNGDGGVMWAYCVVAQRWDRHRPRQRMSVRPRPRSARPRRAHRRVPGVHGRFRHPEQARIHLDRGARDDRRLDCSPASGCRDGRILQDIGESPQHFFHSSYALFLFAGGAVAVVLFWLVELLDAPGERAGRPGAQRRAPVVLVLRYSQTETIWNPFAVDGLTWMFVCWPAGAFPPRRGEPAPVRRRRNRARAVAC